MLLANVAQLVEQFTRNEQVAGSNPAISSKNLLGTFPSKFLCILRTGEQNIHHAPLGRTSCRRCAVVQIFLVRKT